MPNYVLDQSATNVNTAINNVVNAQSAPANGSGLMVTSDGIYQALNDIQHTNFNTGTLVTSSDTIAANISNTQIPTTQAVDAHIDQKIGSKFGLSIGNFSNTYQNTAVAGDNFFKGNHFGGSGGLTGQFSDFTESPANSGVWVVGTSGYYLFSMRGQFNDNSATSHQIYARVDGSAKGGYYYDATKSSQFLQITFGIDLNAGNEVKVTHSLTGGGGGNFQYRNCQLDIIKLT